VRSKTRRRALTVATLTTALAMTLGCGLIVGLDKFDKVDCGVGQCGVTEAGSDDASDVIPPPPDGNLGDVQSLSAPWARWPISNPPSWDAGVVGAVTHPVKYVPDPANGVIKDNVTTLVWDVHDYHTAATELEAETWCSTQSTAGFTWRLPTRIELATLIDFTKPMKALDPAVEAVMAGKVTITGFQWTRSESKTKSGDYWRVSFDVQNPMVTSTLKGAAGVLCVSGGGG
jgi:hypothetical protein